MHQNFFYRVSWKVTEIQHVLDFDQLMAAQVTTTTLDDSFNDDEDFDLDELDPDGFEMGSAEDFENMLY